MKTKSKAKAKTDSKAEKLAKQIQDSCVFSRKIVKKKIAPNHCNFPNYRVTPDIPSLDTRKSGCTLPNAPVYEGDMAEREKLAQVEIAKKKTMVAPIFNKSGYQYIGDINPKDIGKKTSQLEED